MHLSCCEHPVKVYNKYLEKVISVPCGKCDVCRNSKNLLWSQRLEQERLHSAYTIFFTLTYADDYLPLLKYIPSKVEGLEGKLVHVKRDFSKLLTRKKLSDEYNSFEIPVSDTVISEPVTQNIINLHDGCIPYCSLYDIQTFFKRLRSKLYRSLYGRSSDIPKESLLRYFVAHELGPTSLRPHVHGLLYTDSKAVAEAIRVVLSQSWLFGRIDVQFVQSSASSYVASYLNSTSHLPSIYRVSGLRPFHQCSRATPLGLRSLTEEQVSDIFYSQSSLIPVKDASSGSFSLVPIWRSLEDRLYPKLPRHSSLPSDVRLELLRQFTFLPQGDFCSFCQALKVKSDNGYNRLLCDYFSLICPKYKYHQRLVFNFYDEPIVRSIYYCVRRVCSLCSVYCIGLGDYNHFLDLFERNKALYKLSIQYRFEEDFSNKYNCRFLLNIDSIKFDYYRTVTYSQLKRSDFLILRGFGFTDSDFNLMKDENSKSRLFDSLYMSNVLEYQQMVATHRRIFLSSHKTSKKNEYLERHPEFKNLY